MPQIRSINSRAAVAVPRPLWQRAVFFSVAYFLCAQAGVYLSVQNTPYQSFWLPSGLFVGMLLLSETREWPALATVKQFAGLLGYAAILSTMLGAAIGAAALSATGLSRSFLQSWEIWWGSTAMAVLILTPFILTWFSGAATARHFPVPPRKILEASVLMAALVLLLINLLALGAGINSPNKGQLVPLLLWAGIRFGLRGATAANLVLALLTGLFTTQFQRGLTPADLASGNYVLTLQMVLAVGALVGLVPALALNERDNSLDDLRKSEEKYAKVFRSSPAGVLLTEIETGRYIEVNESFCRLYGLTEIETGRYIEVNESFCRLYGYSHDETIGSSSLELGIFESAVERNLLIEPLRNHGFVRDLQMRTRTRAGEIRTVIVNAELIKLDGRQCLLSVIYDITSRLEAEVRLARSREQLRALLSRLQTLREEERTHLAREIHDHLGQLLTALKLDLRLIERKLPGLGENESSAAIHGKLNSAKILVDETITSVQKIASELRPAILDRLGLEAAIEVETRAFETRAHVQCDCELPKTPLDATPEQATAVFRIFQELLTNIARHAQATHVKVRLSRREGNLALEVQDDGVGLKPADLDNPKSLGLLGMQERAVILGGNIVFGPGDGTGTTVTLLIPAQRT